MATSQFPSNEVENTSKELFKKSLLIKGVIWLALVTIASVAILFFYSHSFESIRALSSIKIKYLVICFVMLFIDLLLGSWRNHIFIRILKPGISHWVSFKANLANMFMGAITPFHSGAGPAQLYVYNRYGVKVLDGFIVSLINMGATLLFMPLSGLFAIWMMHNQLESGLVPILLKYGFLAFFIFLLVFLMAFWKPLWVGSVIVRMSIICSRIRPSKKERILHWGKKSYNNIIHYQQICKKLLGDHPYLLPISLLTTTILYLNKYSMQYIILLGLGVSVDLVQVICIEILIEFMIYFAPSPGGSGFAEVSIAVLFSKILPTSILPAFTLLQRSFLLFIPALVGAFVIIILLKKHTTSINKTKVE
ncbi:lysylphosphatidylglycerol synthase transmembrane domain-containing protein [Rhizosphaericola mali]|uniref:Flippase-like domain-containing protein n=1 Tax=Rhizosphaericola mali TaxID=2545455 RepID=A0A5P2G1L5_9BACT|nr:lysylphosphatidylglycerol synthase transmembrane domain-containing protein [Rhizosphaericola mali]QES88588.1 flippase-like domain-containing protein [Rhizosphaericola mali]